MQSQNLLKIASILMMIGGVVGGIAGVAAILGISALAALSGSAEGIGLHYAGSVLGTVVEILIVCQAILQKISAADGAVQVIEVRPSFRKYPLRMAPSRSSKSVLVSLASLIRLRLMRSC